MNVKGFAVLALGVLGLFFSTCKSVDMSKDRNYSGPSIDSLWQVYDSMDILGYPESAEKQLVEIEQAAISLGSESDRMAAIFHRYNLLLRRAGRNEIPDESPVKFLLDKEVPAQTISHHLLEFARVTALISYYQQKQYKVEERTSLASSSLDDPLETWTRNHFLEAIFHSADQAFHPRLKEASVKDWGSILKEIEDSTAIQFRPHLFTVVAHSLSEKLSGSLLQSIPFSDHPVFRDSMWWADREVFLDHDFGYRDESAGRIAQIFQLALSEVEDSKVLLDIDLMRYQFIRSHGWQPEREARWKDVVESFLGSFSQESIEARLATELAEYYYNKGGELDDQGFSGYQKSLKVIQQYKLDERTDIWGEYAKQFKLGIFRPHLSAQIESVLLPEQALLVSCTYRNVEKLHYQVFRVSKQVMETLNRRNREEFMRQIKKQSLQKQGKLSLPNNPNYTMSTAEFGIEGFPTGLYVVLLGAENASFWQEFQVSDLAVVRLDNELFILDRKTGKGLADVLLEFEEVDWRAENQDTFRLKTDDQGRTKVAFDESARLVRATKGDRQWFPDIRIHTSGRPSPGRLRTEVKILTDRSIYRPGQTLRLKGIVFQRSDMGKEQIMEGLGLEVSLRDPNNEVIQKINLQSDKLGSFTLDFRLPQGAMPGTYSIRTPFGSKTVEVAEYRRPSFTVETKWPQGVQYVAGDSIALELIAETFNGFPLTDADVHLTVYRTYTPIWRYAIWPNRREQKKLVHEAHLKLEQGGRASVQFATDPIQKTGIASRYEISATVIDESGETQEISENITLSMSPFTLGLPLSGQVWGESLPSKDWTLRNAMGEPVKAEIRWVLYELPAASSKKASRYWPMPDTILMSRQTFISNWPHLSYLSDDKLHSDGDEEMVREGKVTIDGSTTPPRELFADLSAGRFTLRAFDLQGKQLVEKQFDHYPSTQTTSLSEPKLFWRKSPQNFVAGDTVTLEIIKPAAEARTWVAYQQGGSPIYSQSGGELSIKTAALPIGSIKAISFSVLHNRVYSDEVNIQLRRPEKEIEIKKLQIDSISRPGEKEVYRFDIKHSGPIQLVGTMYDQSLDAIQSHNWSRLPLAYQTASMRFSAYQFSSRSLRTLDFFNYPRSIYTRPLEWPSFILETQVVVRMMSDVAHMDYEVPIVRKSLGEEPPVTMESRTSGDQFEDQEATRESQGPIRENLKETVFFIPNIQKNEDGQYEVDFEMNEALTKWKLLLFAHDEHLSSGVFSTSVVSKQEVSIRSFLPRVLRAGDTIELTARVESEIDLADAELSIEIRNGISGMEVTDEIIQGSTSRSTKVEAGTPKAIRWKIIVPEPSFAPALQIITKVNSEKGSDGESKLIPVLTDRVQLFRTQPFELEANNSGSWDVSSESIPINVESGQRIMKYKLDVNLQPVWQAIQALPYLSKPRNASATAQVNRLFANSLARKVAKSIPQIGPQLNAFAQAGMGESPLSQSQEWKNTDLAQTPWVQSALGETQQMEQIAALLDDNRQMLERREILRDLKQRQNSDGGFPWMPGGRSSIYVTQYLAKELLRMYELDLVSDDEIQPMVNRSLQYCFKYFEEYYTRNKKTYLKTLSKQTLVYMYYLGEHVYDNKSFAPWENWSTFKPQIERYLHENVSTLTMAQQALLALAWERQGRTAQLEELMKSWRERARKNTNLGWSWSTGGRFDYFHSQLEAQALIIEVCERVGATEMSQAAKTYLIKEKQVQQWGNSKTTAAAIHALLLSGQNQLWQKPREVKWKAIGNQPQPNLEIGQAFIHWERSAFPDGTIESPVDKLELNNPNPFPIWGSVQIQYSSPLNAISAQGDENMKVRTVYYLEKKGSEGLVLEPIVPDTRLKKGDVLVARVLASVDRTMDFVHIEQFRPSNLEPMVQKSGYENMEGLSTYRAVKDEGTHFFIDQLPEGDHVFEFKERVVHAGTCAAGFTRMESFYAPEFKTHGTGEKIKTYVD